MHDYWYHVMCGAHMPEFVTPFAFPCHWFLKHSCDIASDTLYNLFSILLSLANALQLLSGTTCIVLVKLYKSCP